MSKPYKAWICHDCKFLSLAGDYGVCESQAKFESEQYTLEPLIKATMALEDTATKCEYKVQGKNGIFDIKY